MRLRIALLSLAALAAGSAHAQRVVAWGGDGNGQTDLPTLVSPRRIAASAYNAAAIHNDGTITVWGDNGSGQQNVPSTAMDPISIALGGFHGLALLSNNTVVAWGSNSSDQAKPPAGLSDVIQVAAGRAFSLALKSDGDDRGMGDNPYGEITTPAGLGPVTQIAAGDYHTLALKSDGTVAAWGYDTSGQCDVPTGLKTVTQIAGGSVHSLALKANGTVVGWGDNTYGETAIPAGLNGVVAISGGGGHSLALKSDGTVVAWGLDNQGQCDVPANLSGVVAISAGGYASYAIVAAAWAKLDQTGVFSGYSATGTVHLADPAGPGGTEVGISSDDMAVHVPATVTVPEGATTVTFPVTTDLFFGSDRTATIRTIYGSTPTLLAKLKVKGNAATTTFGYPTVVGGSTTKPNLTVRFAWAPAADATLTLASSDAAATIPATITIPAGEKSAKVLFNQTRVPTDRTVTVTGAYGGNAVSMASFKLSAFRTTVTFDSPTIYGGDATTGIVYLNATARESLTFPLSSGDASVTVPAMVTVKANARSAVFSVASVLVPTTKTVPVTATLNATPYVGVIRVIPVPAVNAVTLATSTFGNGQITGSVHLTAAARAGGTVVTLTSSSASLAVPASVTVAEGEYTANFTATSADVANATNATVTGKAGLGTATATVAIQPLTIGSLTLSAATVTGGMTLTGTVALNVPVAADTVVALSSDTTSAATVPATVTIPAGSRTATFTITTLHAATVKMVKITASKNGTSAYRTLKVMP